MLHGTFQAAGWGHHFLPLYKINAAGRTRRAVRIRARLPETIRTKEKKGRDDYENSINNRWK